MTEPIYKYFHEPHHMNRFLKYGEVMFMPLAYYLNCEESIRDTTEGSNYFSPQNGLEINVSDGRKITLTGSLTSRLEPNRIFAFCTSLEKSKFLYQKWGAKGCVKIHNVEAFKALILRHIKNEMLSVKNHVLLADRINYYDPRLGPEARYIIPEQIIMSKPIDFVNEKEFRFAFTQDKNAFEFGNVNLNIELTSEQKYPIPVRGKLLTLGSLRRISEIIYFD